MEESRVSSVHRGSEVIYQDNHPSEPGRGVRVAELLGVRHCIAMCNGTIALEITIRAAGLTGEGIVPAWTFVPAAIQ